MGGDCCILDRTEIHLSCGILYISYTWLLIHLDERIVTDGSTLDSATKLNNEERKSTFSTRLRTAMLPALRLMLFISIICGVIVGGNYLYIIIHLKGTTSDQKIFQFCFAAFKLFWSMVATPYVFESKTLHFGVDVKHHDALILSLFGGNYQLLFVMNIFTNFLIPMLTIAVVDDTCFYNMFFQADSASTSFYIDKPFQTTAGKANVRYVIKSTSIAPFTYGYTCSDSMMRIYVPLYMQMSTLLVLKSITSLIYLCWGTYDAEKREGIESGILHMFMNLLSKLAPTNQLLYGNSQRRAEYDPGRVFKSNIKLWITGPLPGHLANMVVLLTFGLAAPPLALMSVINIVMDSYVCQLVLGRFIESEVAVLLEQKRQSEDIVDSPMKPEGHFVSLMRRARMQEAIKDVDEPWGALAALKELEAQCEHVPASALARGRAVFVLITSTLLAMLLIDIDNSSSSQQSLSAGAAIAMMSFAFTLVSLAWMHGKYSVNENKKSVGRRSCNSGRIVLAFEMSDIKSVSVDGLRTGVTINPINCSAIAVDEIPSPY